MGFHLSWDEGEQVVSMPAGATLISAAVANDQLKVYAIADPDEPPEDRGFYVRATGSPLRVTAAFGYVGTVTTNISPPVWHVFNRLLEQPTLALAEDSP